MIQNLHLLRCYRSCLVANKLHEAKRTNIRNYTRRNDTAKTAPNFDEQYGWIHVTLRNVTQWHKESAHKILLQLALLHKNNKPTQKNVRRCDLHWHSPSLIEWGSCTYLTLRSLKCLWKRRNVGPCWLRSQLWWIFVLSLQCTRG